MTTPLEREILTHFWVTQEPLPVGLGGSLREEIVQRFFDAGLLVETDDGSGRLVCNYDAVGVYMEALAAVPLPIQRWVVPSL